ncbi:MAG TPA: hypothetical protein VE172_16750, partial [Stackebrandtia sp.]|nr:hypothetical protein [Stackebrandtia sp.]
MDSDQHSPESESASRPYTGRHRPALLTRTVFAALATATLIGAGVTAAGAATPSATGTGTSLAADGHDSPRADRHDARRDVPRDEPSPKSTHDKPEPNKPKVKPKPKPAWVVPSPEDISDTFGPRGWRGGEMHYGTDFLAAEGERNYAAAAGVVVQAGPNGGYG